MPGSFDIDDDEKAALVELLLREMIERDRFPLSRRVKRLRGILAELGLGSAPAMPYDAPKPPGERSAYSSEDRANARQGQANKQPPAGVRYNLWLAIR